MIGVQVQKFINNKSFACQASSIEEKNFLMEIQAYCNKFRDY